MPNILITGGTGFVGHWMRETKPANVSVTYIGHKTYDELIKRNWRDLRFDGVIHLAPVSPHHAILCTLANHARMLYCSSGIVYYPENDTQYRRDKLAGEADCVGSGANVVIARLFTFSGAKLDDDKAISQFYKAALAGKPLELRGDGATVRSYMHGYDMGKMMWDIFEHGKRGFAYDVGSLVPITMLELAEFVIHTTKSQSKIVFVDKPNPMPYYMPEKERIFNG